MSLNFFFQCYGYFYFKKFIVILKLYFEFLFKIEQLK